MLDMQIKIGPDSAAGEPDTLLNIDIKEYHYPIYFERRNICVSCGAEGELAFINIFGKEATSETRPPFERIRCKRCGAEYSIRWDKSEDGMLHPTAVDRTITKDFLNTFKNKKIKEFDDEE